FEASRKNERERTRGARERGPVAVGDPGIEVARSLLAALCEREGLRRRDFAACGVVELEVRERSVIEQRWVGRARARVFLRDLDKLECIGDEPVESSGR